MKLAPPKLHADRNMREDSKIWDAQNRFRTQALPIATAAAALVDVHDQLMAEAERTGEAPEDSFERWCDHIEILRQELLKAGYTQAGNLQ